MKHRKTCLQTNLKPGYKIGSYDTNNVKVAISLGYPAKGYIDGVMYYGFITCGHGTQVNGGIYYMASTNNQVAHVLAKHYQNNSTVDASFAVTETGNSVLYNIKNCPFILDGTQSDVSLGETLYKNGGKSGNSNSTVICTCLSAHCYDDNLGISYYLTDMIATSTMTSSGDSGGIAYVATGENNGRGASAVGIVKGAGGGYSAFIKASNITSVMGFTAR